MKQPKIILIHGNGGSTAYDCWLPYVKNTLTKLDLHVIAQTMPDNILARQEYWLPFLKDQLHADQNTILVGHSSGAVAAMRFAESNTIFGSVLVGACYTDLGDKDEKASGYYDRPWDWNKIRDQQNWIIQFASTNDPYIPIEQARHIHKQLRSDYFESADEGHFDADSKVNTEFPALIQALKTKLGI